jgi:hypothetical protein
VFTAVSREPRDPGTLDTIDADRLSFGIPDKQLSSEDEAREIFAAAVECCRGLLKTSMLIRNASSRDRFTTALQRTGDLFLDQFDINHTLEKFPKLAEPGSEWLAKRLGRAITMRRHFLRYCREHQDSLGGRRGNNTNSSQIVSNTPPGPADANKTADGGHLPPATDSGKSQMGFTDPGTKASTLFAGQLEVIQEGPEDGAVSYTSAARSDFTSEDALLEVPSLLSLTKGKAKAEFECPLCHILQKFKGKREWRCVLSRGRTMLCPTLTLSQDSTFSATSSRTYVLWVPLAVISSCSRTAIHGLITSCKIIVAAGPVISAEPVLSDRPTSSALTSAVPTPAYPSQRVRSWIKQSAAP